MKFRTHKNVWKANYKKINKILREDTSTATNLIDINTKLEHQKEAWTDKVAHKISQKRILWDTYLLSRTAKNHNRYKPTLL